MLNSHPSNIFAGCSFDGKSVCARFIALLIWISMLASSFAAESKLGDIDGDGVVSVLDIVKLNSHADKKGTLGEDKKIFADVDQDGVINDADRELLVKEILGTRDPSTLPLAKVRETSPADGESDVAVTRETILYFTIPLHENTTIDSTKFYAKFGERRLLTRATLSSDRRKATLFYLEPIPASATITVTLDSEGLKDLSERSIDADGDGVAGGVFKTSFNTLGITALPSTKVVGRVLSSQKGGDGQDIPIQGAIITVDGQEETLRAVTDASGNFTLSPAPGGSFFVHIDARTASGSSFPDGDYYPIVGKKWFAEAGRDDNRSGDIDDTKEGGGSGVIYLPLVKAGSLKAVSETVTTIVTAPVNADADLNEKMQGVKLEVPPGSLFSDDGTRGGSVGIAPVAPDRLPSPLPEGLDLPLVITVQTNGATNFERPVPVTFPNLPDPKTGEKLAPGEKSALWSFNHDTGKWEIVGPMTVTDDGDFVTTDAGVGLLQPGWHGTRPGAWGEGKVCHACSKQVGKVWSEASGLAYGISLNAAKLNDMYLAEVDNVVGTPHYFNSIQFKGSSGAPAGFTDEQYASLLSYIGKNQDDWWSQFSKLTASLATPELIAKSIKQLEKLTQGNPGQVDWWPAVEGLVEWKPVQDKIVALDLPIRMTLLAWATLTESEEIDEASDELKELKSKQENLLGLIKGCLNSKDRKKDATDKANQNEELQAALVAQIETELAAWSELLEKTPDLEIRISESNATPANAPAPLPSSEKTKDNAKQWLNYLKKVRSLLLLLQKKDQSLIQDFEELIGIMDQYFTQMNQFVVECDKEEEHEKGKEKQKVESLKDLYILLQSPSLDERFISKSGFISRVLAARTPYLMKVYSVKSHMLGSVFFVSPATGSSRQIPTVPMYEDKGEDADGDGLSDEAEGVIGTDPSLIDSDKDGMNDMAELQNGTDPMINNTDPSSSKPVRTGIIGTLPVFNGVSAVDVDVDDGTMAVAMGTAGIGIYDVTVATAPLRIKEYKVGGDVVSVAVGRNYAVGAAGSRGVAIVPLSVDPENPVEAVIVKLKSPVNAVTTDGSLAYAGLENGDVVVVDLASGLEITRIETTLGAIEDIDYGAGNIIARGRSSTQIFYLGDEGFEKVGETVSSSWSSWRGRLRLTYVNDQVIATNLMGFQNFDISDPKSPVTVGSYTDGQLGWKHMAATGSGLGVAVNSINSGSEGDVSVYNFRYAFASTQEDRDKTYLTTISTPGDAMAVSIYNGFAFVADSSSGVQVINFMPYDSKGVKPTIRLESNFDLTVDPATGKGKVDEGKRMLLKAIVSDDVMVRNVELYINGEKFATDGNYPFEFTEITPLRSVMTEFKLKARAYDTGGNYEETEEITLELFPDSVPPKIVRNFPAKNDLIAPLEKVWVRFSEPMDEVSLAGDGDAQAGAVHSLSAGADKQLGTADDVQIPFTGSFNTDTDIYTLSFEAPLEPGLYQFVVGDTAKDLAGNSLSNPMTDVQFRVYSDDDSDEDGIPDDWEVKLGYDPFNAYSRWIANGGSIDDTSIEDGEYDTDNDGLSDAGEIIMETALDKNDSDGDGILDGNEDSDLDGLRDGLEISYGTDPFNVDTDGDELDDNSEIADGTDPQVKNPMPFTLVSQPASYIKDFNAPVITLIGGNPMTVFKGILFQDPGATVTDNIDSTKTINGNGEVDTSVLGNYNIAYTAKDLSGNEAAPVTRTIVVVLNPLGDEDGDGLENEREANLGTDPFQADTDGDGYMDKYEVEEGSDPLDKEDFPAANALGSEFFGTVAWSQGKEVEYQLPIIDDDVIGKWSLASGALPDGLVLAADGKKISGTPTVGGIKDYVLRYKSGMGYDQIVHVRSRITPTTAIGGGYSFTNLAGALWGYFSGSADAGGAYTGSGDGFTGSSDGFSGSADGSRGFIGSADGMGGWIGNKDGIGSDAMFHRPGGVSVASDGSIYVSDTGNNAIRKIAPDGQVTKIAGNFLGSSDGNFLGSSDGVFSGSADGTGEGAGFRNPQGIVVDKDGNILVADRKNHAIRKVTPQGLVTTVAGSFTGSGTGGLTGSSDGSASGARFDHPSDVVVDAQGNILVADSGNHAIRKIDASGNVTTIAGRLGQSGYTDATRDSAMFNSPQGIAIDADGNIIVADTTNGLIRKISSSGNVTTLAGALFTNNAGAAFIGSGGEAFTGSAGEGGRSGLSDKAYGYFTGSLDGFTGSSDGFTGSADGSFTGSADLGWPASVDGTGENARFSFPTDVDVDADGNIFVVDSGSGKIRKISPDGVVATIGNSPDGFFYMPIGVAVDANGRVIVADSGNNRIAGSATGSNTQTTPQPGSSGGGSQ